MSQLDDLKFGEELMLVGIDRSDSSECQISITYGSDEDYPFNDQWQIVADWPAAPGDSVFRVRRNFTKKRYAEEFLTGQFVSTHAW